MTPAHAPMHSCFLATNFREEPSFDSLIDELCFRYLDCHIPVIRPNPDREA